jgi:hypothetical protein
MVVDQYLEHAAPTWTGVGVGDPERGWQRWQGSRRHGCLLFFDGTSIDFFDGISIDAFDYRHVRRLVPGGGSAETIYVRFAAAFVISGSGRIARSSDGPHCIATPR